MSKKISFLTKHLHSVGETYFEHMRHSLYFGINCLRASFFLFTHALFPFIFLTNGSSILKKLYHTMSLRNQVGKLASTNSQDRHVAIIGFGLSGLLAFLNLVTNYKKSPAKLVIRVFEKSRFFTKGIAYSTKNINHLLNVPAYLMGVKDEDREHFFKWLKTNGYPYEKHDFVPRQIFGIYLEDILQSALKIADEKGISYEFLNHEISDIKMLNEHYAIEEYAYNHCILATGVRLKNWSNNFWHIDLNPYLNQKEIHIAGCGLTAFDAVISLRDLNYQGTIFMHSRTQKLPQIHKKPNDSEKKIELPLTLNDAKLPLSLIFKKFVTFCKNSPNWRLCFDAIRPMTQDFWQHLSVEKKKRFMRHCFRLWNIHRHRCPESQYEIINEMLKSGKLVFAKGRLNGKNIIDCTGFDYGFKSDLIKNLIKNKIVKSDELSSGISAKNFNFHIMGGLNFGHTFEITAVPDITTQACKISKKILA